MTLLVFGKNGQVASELARIAPDAVFLGRDLADLSNPESCAAQIRTLAPSAIINAAAYTAVDRAEEEANLANLVNGAAPTAMARAAAALDVPFVHISTDYVFDGEGETPFAPDDPVAPQGAYGRSKLIGEDGVRATHPGAVILRTSWVFSAHGNNFVKTMLKHGAQNAEMKVVQDQIGGPTSAADIARAVLKLSGAPNTSGTYHFSGAPDVSWADFAREIFARAGMTTHVRGIPSSEWPTKAKRPLNSRLNCDSLATDFGIARPDWRDALDAVLKELLV